MKLVILQKSLVCDSTDCRYDKSCANHESAGQYRTESGFTPKIESYESAYRCLSVNIEPEKEEPNVFEDGSPAYPSDPVPVNHPSRGMVYHRKGKLYVYSLDEDDIEYESLPSNSKIKRDGMRAKYVMFQDELGTKTFRLFPSLQDHSDLAREVRSHKPGLTPVSAGFVTFNRDDGFIAYGMSVTLKLTSDPDDSKIMNRLMNSELA